MIKTSVVSCVESAYVVIHALNAYFAAIVGIRKTQKIVMLVTMFINVTVVDSAQIVVFAKIV
jgi:hypothetical protein